MKIIISAGSACGKRPENQDSLLVNGKIFQQSERQHKENQIIKYQQELQIEDSTGPLLFAVADGVTCSRYGALASVDALSALATEAYDWKGSASIKSVNDKLYAHYKASGATTVSCCYLENGNIHTYNVGDSPIYVLRKNTLIPMYTPETQAYWKQLNGFSADSISIRDHHTLINFMGSEILYNVVENSSKLEPGDIWLICTDGLEFNSSLKEYLQTSYSEETAGEFAESIIEKMYKSDEIIDNISIIVIGVF